MGAGARDLPEHPVLREFALAIEQHGISGELLDHRWRIVFTSSELLEIVDLDLFDTTKWYGMTPVVRQQRLPELWATDPESSALWWVTYGSMICQDIRPGDPDFEEAFGQTARVAARTEPDASPRMVATSRQTFATLRSMRATWTSDVSFLYQRIHDAAGAFVGVLELSRPAIPESISARLSRGNTAMFERMNALREPVRRSAGILFADLEASGELSRTLSSRAYFELIRALTDVIDAAVDDHGGIIGKHAGDGASALFVVDEDQTVSAMARATIEAARMIREKGAGLLPDGPEVRVNIGAHWGATMTIGQISTSGRLEVTALGDEMNEAARIEHTATGGAILASKGLVERLEPDDAELLGLEPDRLVYRKLSSFEAPDKAVRDAGNVAVVEI